MFLNITSTVTILIDIVKGVIDDNVVLKNSLSDKYRKIKRVDLVLDL